MHRFILIVLCLGLQAPLVWAQNQDALALELGGFPLLDVDGLIDGQTRQRLDDRLTALRDCCQIHLIILIQGRSRSGDMASDADILRRQIARAGLWTDRTVLLIYQSRPPGAIAIVGGGLDGLTPTIGQERLTDLGLDAGGPAALIAFTADMENAARALLRPDPLPPFLRSLGLHMAVIFLGFGLSLLILAYGRRRGGRAKAADFLRPQSGQSVQSVSDHTPPLLPANAAARFGFPAKIIRQGLLRSGERDPLAGVADLLILTLRRPSRHWVWITVLSCLLALLAAGVQESRAAGLGFSGGAGVFWPTDLPFTVRVGLSLTIGLGAAAMLFLTPLGAWVTPPSLRHRVLRLRLAQVILRQPRPCLIFLHRPGRARISIWVPVTLPLRHELLHTPIQRLAEEAAHGQAAEGFQTFVDQFERLARTYLPNPENKEGGKIIRENLP